MSEAGGGAATRGRRVGGGRGGELLFLFFSVGESLRIIIIKALARDGCGQQWEGLLSMMFFLLAEGYTRETKGEGGEGGELLLFFLRGGSAEDYY